MQPLFSACGPGKFVVDVLWELILALVAVEMRRGRTAALAPAAAGGVLQCLVPAERAAFRWLDWWCMRRFSNEPKH